MAFLLVEQVIIMSQKHVSQKQRQGRTFWKETFLIQLFVLLFCAYMLYNAQVLPPTADVYQLHPLPPLSTQNPYGIFSQTADGNTVDTIISKRLYYSPDNHAGVTTLINDLVAKYPNIEAVACVDPGAITNLYADNLFDTWAAMEFFLNEDQISTGLLIPSQTEQTTVSYSILVNPIMSSLSTYNYTSDNYNDEAGVPDAFWASGYMTLQNFVSTYLANQYDNVDLAVDTQVQRYPKSPIYDDHPESFDLTFLRWAFWKWLAPVVISICVFTAMLGLLTEIVRERQFRMKDLLEISGLMNPSYWLSYVVVILVICQITIWITIGILRAFNILNDYRVLPYAGVMTTYSLAVACFSFMWGFLIFRCEYYGLPVFIMNCALAVGGEFLGLAYGITVGTKLFLSFLCPPIGLTMGIFAIETYLYHNVGESMDYNHTDNIKNYPSLNAVNGILLVSALFWFLLTIGMPFDWVWRASNNAAETYVADRENDVAFPSDNEEEETRAKNANLNDDDVLLKVAALSHIYPDGTHAVKDISFNVKEGEVLSFLGANGAGKSTTMGMLCGTLEATFGDAMVNGYSISQERVQARRNLGIAMQQDIIWNDVNVEDHLMLFGRLRGLHGTRLREDVAQMLRSLGFPEKKKSLAGTLSGGQKRRLCVGLSMVGGNSVVYLDEPTAGLDPVSRRQLWELVENNRAGRAILLTTHFMDEADVLGDRIAIVKEGRLRALGTSKFLKNRFGLGYLLRMSLQEGTQPDPIQNVVKRFIPEAAVASIAGTELSLRLPSEAVPVFATLFEDLESRGKSLGVLSFGIETTTLEEVFMRIVNEDNETLVNNHQEANRLIGASAEERDVANKKVMERDEKRNPINEEMMKALMTKGRTDYSSSDCMPGDFLDQVRVMVLKRSREFFRSKGQWSMGVVLPLLIAICVGAIISTMPNDVINDSLGVFLPTYSTTFDTVVAGTDEQAVTDLFYDAFGQTNIKYVGSNYTEMYNYIDGIASSGIGPSSSEAIVLNALNNFTIMYNSSYPINFAGAVTNILNAATTNATKGMLNIDLTYQQLPPNALNGQLNDGLLCALLVALFAGSIGAGMSVVVGGERVSQVKHQQLASGASKVSYWTANFIWDFLVMFIQVLIFAAILAVFSPSVYTPYGYSVVVGGGVFFCISSIFRFYVISFWVADVKMAQTIFFYGSLFSMFLFLGLWFVVVFNGYKGNASGFGVNVMGAIFTLIDPAFGWYVITIYQHNFLAVLDQNEGETVLGKIAFYYFLMLIIGAIFYALVLWLVMEGGLSNFIQSLRNCCMGQSKKRGDTTELMSGTGERLTVTAHDLPPAQMSGSNSSSPAGSGKVHPAPRIHGLVDPDVAAEKERVRQLVQSGNISMESNAIFISNLKKVYYGQGSAPAKVAVKDISITIPHGEVFGLLGANGAGKTTLLKMVSGQEQPTSGFALINGFDVVYNTSEAQRSMGLCPQFDTLVERLTVRENLYFFGQIKGLSGKTLTTVCEAFMVAMNIKRYQNKLIQQLSGGNRRKVSLAVALLGAPPTVYLDEPSTGLDPVASRLMWRLLSKISSAKSTAIVLTTHNMLECEAVCTRICIMKLGEMVCLGDSQHLRSVHGTGFLLEMTLSNTNKVDAAKQFVFQTFQGAVVVDEHATMINFEIPRVSIIRLSEAFRTMEEKKAALGIVDYALSQSTLEQVFLKQIRPSQSDMKEDDDQKAIARVPHTKDYVFGYAVWLAAGFLPGLHHYYLGNKLRALKYLITLNEAYAGWFLDLFEMHVLIQKSVQQYGHSSGCCYTCPTREVESSSA